MELNCWNFSQKKSQVHFHFMDIESICRLIYLAKSRILPIKMTGLIGANRNPVNGYFSSSYLFSTKKGKNRIGYAQENRIDADSNWPKKKWFSECRSKVTLKTESFSNFEPNLGEKITVQLVKRSRVSAEKPVPKWVFTEKPNWDSAEKPDPDYVTKHSGLFL